MKPVLRIEQLVEVRRVTRRDDAGTILAAEFVEECWVPINEQRSLDPDYIYVPLSQDRVWEIRADGGTVVRHRES